MVFSVLHRNKFPVVMSLECTSGFWHVVGFWRKIVLIRQGTSDNVSCIGSFMCIYRGIHGCCENKWSWRAERALIERAAGGSRYTMWICEDFIFLRLASLIYISEVSICATTKFAVSEFQKKSSDFPVKCHVYYGLVEFSTSVLLTALLSDILTLQ